MQVVGYAISRRSQVPARAVAAKADKADLPAPRRVYYGPGVGWLETPVIGRGDLDVSREGPCIVEEYDATVVIPPHSKAELDPYGNILIELQ